MPPTRTHRLRGDLQVNDPAQRWDAVLRLPFGCLGVRCDGRQLLQTEYLGLQAGAGAGDALEGDTALAQRALLRRLQQWLLAYCADPSVPPPDLPLGPGGTPFQRRVWQALRAIPVGTVLSYGAFARQLGSSARAVGQACGANPFAPLVPCHRVVARDHLGGFAGSRDPGGEWLAIKRWLLRHENALPLPGRGPTGDG